MASGAVSVAQLLLNDINWHHSKIRIRAQKGGKGEAASAACMESVGDAIIEHLKQRAVKVAVIRRFGKRS